MTSGQDKQAKRHFFDGQLAWHSRRPHVHCVATSSKPHVVLDGQQFGGFGMISDSKTHGRSWK